MNSVGSTIPNDLKPHRFYVTKSSREPEMGFQHIIGEPILHRKRRPKACNFSPLQIPLVISLCLSIMPFLSRQRSLYIRGIFLD